MLSRETAEKHLDVLLQILHAIDELVGDKLIPAELALAGVKAALASLNDDKIGEFDPEEIRAIAKRLRPDVKTLDAEKDQKLHDKFDVSKDDRD